MKFQLPSIAAAALLALPLSQAHKYPIDIDITVTTTTSTETTNPVLSALRENGLDKYADYLETRAPLTLARFSGRPSLTLYAPSNSVEAPAFTNSTLHRRNPYDDEANACALCIDDSTPAPPKRNLHNYDHHHHDDDKTTGFSVHRTFLKDPNYINLGEGEYLKLVSGSSNSSAGVQIRVGGGKVVTSSATPIRFSNGVIYVIEA